MTLRTALDGVFIGFKADFDLQNGVVGGFEGFLSRDFRGVDTDGKSGDGRRRRIETKVFVEGNIQVFANPVDDGNIDSGHGCALMLTEVLADVREEAQ